jgi:uncharacterized membrane protein
LAWLRHSFPLKRIFDLIMAVLISTEPRLLRIYPGNIYCDCRLGRNAYPPPILSVGVKPKERSMTRLILAAAVATAFAIPAFAQSTTVTEYYVVQDASTKKCTIVDKKPTTTTMVQVGPVAFKTRAEAESGMNTIKVCESK